MFQRQNDKNLYFSTRVELKINGATYRPSICYQVPSLARKSLEKFADAGKVTFYEQPVRFVNGAVTVSITNKGATDVPSVVNETSEINEVKISKRKNK